MLGISQEIQSLLKELKDFESVILDVNKSISIK